MKLMGEQYNVKARVHHGSESLDLTIPAELRRDLGITPGDLFIVSAVANSEGNLVIECERSRGSDRRLDQIPYRA
jgi:antitoxin component of MazEF toxin-antitoxin module